MDSVKNFYAEDEIGEQPYCVISGSEKPVYLFGDLKTNSQLFSYTSVFVVILERSVSTF